MNKPKKLSLLAGSFIHTDRQTLRQTNMGDPYTFMSLVISWSSDWRDISVNYTMYIKAEIGWVVILRGVQNRVAGGRGVREGSLASQCTHSLQRRSSLPHMDAHLEPLSSDPQRERNTALGDRRKSE